MTVSIYDQHESSSSDVSTLQQSFYALTIDHVLDVVEQFGLRCTGRCLQLNSMENRVYEVEVEVDEDSMSSPSDRFRILKCYRPGRWSEEQILAEHRFLLELARQEIPVVTPLQTEQGVSLIKDQDTGIYCALFYKLGGRNAVEITGDGLERVGRLLGRIHNVGAAAPAPSRLQLNPTTYGREHLDFFLRDSILPDSLREQFTTLINHLCDTVEPWFTEAEPIRLHGDAHPGNLLERHEQFFWVDFDDMLNGPAVQDLWLLLPDDHLVNPAPLEAMLRGYQMMRPFNRSTLRLIEPLRALRMVHYAAWVARRWSDPIFPRTFPEFGTENYWGRLYRDLFQVVYERMPSNTLF